MRVEVAVCVPLVTCSLKACEPTVEGIPIKSPRFGTSVIPGGVESADQFSVPPTPPCAARKKLIGLPTGSAGSVAVVMVSTLVGVRV